MLSKSGIEKKNLFQSNSKAIFVLRNLCQVYLGNLAESRVPVVWPSLNAEVEFTSYF